MKKLLTLVSVTAALGSAAGAQGTISAQSIIVNPAPSNVAVQVWTDRDASGTGMPAYAPGDKIRLFVKVSQDAYVYLFNVDPNGQVDMVLPNKYQSGGNFLKANAVKVFPASGDPFTFDIAAPYGLNKVLALASRTPLNMDQIATFKAQQNSFASVRVQGQQQLAQALSIVVTPVQQNSWNCATAYYQVVSRTATTPAPRPTPLTNVRPGTTPVQPAPQASSPAPQPSGTVTALSINVIPLGPNGQSPWGNALEWKTTLDGRYDIKRVHDQYAALLKKEGWTQTRYIDKNNRVSSEYRNLDQASAELTVKRVGNKIEIEFKRRNARD